MGEPLDRHRHEDVAKALKARLSELTGRVAEIDSELRTPLPADSDDRATDLESHDALEGIENSRIQEINQIGEALKRIAEGYLRCLRPVRRRYRPETPKGTAERD
jgi:RNA polymerase-binding transcription factor DksA